MSKRRTVIILKLTSGLAVPLTFKYKMSLLKIVRHVSCQE